MGNAKNHFPLLFSGKPAEIRQISHFPTFLEEAGNGMCWDSRFDRRAGSHGPWRHVGRGRTTATSSSTFREKSNQWRQQMASPRAQEFAPPMTRRHRQLQGRKEHGPGHSHQGTRRGAHPPAPHPRKPDPQVIAPGGAGTAKGRRTMTSEAALSSPRPQMKGASDDHDRGKGARRPQEPAPRIQQRLKSPPAGLSFYQLWQSRPESPARPSPSRS